MSELTVLLLLREPVAMCPGEAAGAGTRGSGDGNCVLPLTGDEVSDCCRQSAADMTLRLAASLPERNSKRLTTELV